MLSILRAIMLTHWPSELCDETIEEAQNNLILEESFIII